MSIATIPWLQGKNVQIQITPQNVSTLGVLSANAVGTMVFKGLIDSDVENFSYSVENVSPRDWINTNPYVYEYSDSFTITEIPQAWPLRTAGTDYQKGNILKVCERVARYHYVQVSWLEDDISTVVNSEASYVLMHSLDRTTPKASGRLVGTFSTVIVYDTATGISIANPALGSP